MTNMYISKYWMVVAVWTLLYIESGRTEEISLNLDDLPIDNYTTELKTVAPNALSGWYKMTNGFISAVHSKSRKTFDILIEFAKGKKIEIPGSVVTMLKLQYAIFACVVIGFLFTVIMFIAGIIFFCCRMCGKCGGKRVQVITSTTGVWRTVLILLLVIFLAFLLPAVICMFAINNSLNSSVSETEKIVDSSLYDVEIFLNNTEKQVFFIASNGVKKTVIDITKKILDVAGFIENELIQMPLSLSFEEPNELLVHGWPKIAEKVNEAVEAGENITSITSQMIIIMTDLQSAIHLAKQSCSEENKQKCIEIKEEAFIVTDNANINMSPLNEIKTAFEELDVENYGKIAIDFQKSFNNIPSEMATKTWPIRKDVIDDLQAFGKEVLNSDNLKSLENFTNLARNAVQKLHHEANKIFPTVRKNDEYRWYGGLVISIIIAIVAGGLFLGLFFGICGYRYNRSATKRTTMSNGAGLILMFSVYWMFFFSGLLMLITTFLFAVGGTGEVYLCRPLFDEKFEVLDQVMTAIQSSAFNTSSIAQNIVPSNALMKCANNGTAYEAFNLEHMNLTAMLNYKEKLKLEERLQQLQKVEPPQLKILTDHANKAIASLNKALNSEIPDDMLEKLNESIITDGYSAEVEKILKINEISMQDVGEKAKRSEEAIRVFEGKRIEFGMGLQNISTVRNLAKYHLQLLVEKFQEQDQVLPTVIQGITNKAIEKFVTQLTDYGDNIIRIVIESFEKKIAPCKPLWNVFDSTRTVLCKYTIQQLNGMWFAIGWSLFFFIPAIIVATKLSKHFRRMKHVASSENDEKNPYEIELHNGYKVKPDDGWYSPSHHL